MSWQQLRLALAATCDTPAEKLLLVMLANHADHGGGSFYPGYDLLASETGYSERHIITVLKELESKGRVRIERRRGRQRTNNYWLNLPKQGEAGSPFERGKGEVHSSEKVNSVPGKGETGSHPLYPSRNHHGNPPPIYASTVRRQIESLDQAEKEFSRNKEMQPDYWKRNYYVSQADGKPYTSGWKPTQAGETKLKELAAQRQELNDLLARAI